jgi:hypothetical protein
MEMHILNGDALAEKFTIPGDIIVFRECLIEGPVAASSLKSFWEIRKDFLSGGNQAQKEFYNSQAKHELEKLLSVQPGIAINLWFEHDLFCQANMWFILSFIALNKIQNPIFRVAPVQQSDDNWSGFGRMHGKDLKICFENRIRFSKTDLDLGARLWSAYQQNDFETLISFAERPSQCFPRLKEVCQAHIERFSKDGLGRPQKRLQQIIKNGHTDFSYIFNEFTRTEGIYGFGDSQVKNMLSQLKL